MFVNVRTNAGESASTAVGLRKLPKLALQRAHGRARAWAQAKEPLRPGAEGSS